MALALYASAPAIHAQQPSRADEIAARQADKATRLAPQVPSRAEQIFTSVQSKLLLEPSGFFPTTDTVYSGGGFTLGGGYRSAFGDDSSVDLLGMYSVKGYKKVQAGLRSRGHLDGRASFYATGGWRDATQVGYYGLGIATSSDQRANFRFKQTYATASTEVYPIRWVVLGGGLGVEQFTQQSGKGSYPSVEQLYTAETAPGLGTSPTYLRATAIARLDWRTAPGYSRKGGSWGATFNRYAGIDETSSFGDVRVDAVQHIPFLRETWVVSLRGQLQSVVGEASDVPYFLTPALGGGSTLRGYDSFRFRDRSTWLMSAEWRWIPSQFVLDLALFYDAGTVASEVNRLDFGSLKSNWGAGVRFHGLATTPLRVEVAKGNEGLQLVFAGSAAF
jgi:hypothetical protein